MPKKILLYGQSSLFDDDGIFDTTDINTASSIAAGTAGLDPIFDSGAQSSGADLPNSHFVTHFNFAWTAIASGDFNGDGTTDVLWQNADGLVAEWFMGNGTLQGTKTLQTMPGWTVASGDFNGDGTSDLMWWTPQGSVAVYAADWLMSKGTIALTQPVHGATRIIASGDYNH